MRKLLFFVCAVFLVMLASCSSPSLENKTEINLKEAVASSDRKSIETYCESLSYVKLETSGDVLLRSPFYIFTPNTIVAYENHALYQFSYTGEFLKSYVRHGQGPKDILHINDAMWNEERQELLVVDGIGKILVFDEKLDFLYTQPFRMWTYDALSVGDYIYCGLARDDFRKPPLKAVGRYHIPNGERELMFDSEFPYCDAKMFSMFSLGTDIARCDTTIYFHEYRSDSIFSFTLNDSTKRLAYHLNVGEICPAELDYNNEILHGKSNYLMVNRCVHADNFMFIFYSYHDEKQGMAVYHKDTGKTFCLKKSESNSIDGGLPINSLQWVKGKTYCAGSLLPSYDLSDEFVARVKECGNTDSGLMEVLSRTTDDDNPILMFVVLK